MQAIILAAGRGTRLKELTQTTPKSLVHVCGKPILQHTLESLPSIIDEAIVVVGYCGDQIRSYLGDVFNDIKLTYIEQTELNGTGGALWQARPLLKSGKFIVLNGDDIYNQKEILACTEYDLAVGVNKRVPSSAKYLAIGFGDDGSITTPRYPTEQEMIEGAYICTGCYVLDQRIFEYQPVQLSNGELGLPQTIFKMLDITSVQAVPMETWHQINSPEDIPFAEAYIKGI